MSCSISVIPDIRREIREAAERLECDDGYPGFVVRNKYGGDE